MVLFLHATGHCNQLSWLPNPIGVILNCIYIYENSNSLVYIYARILINDDALFV